MERCTRAESSWKKWNLMDSWGRIECLQKPNACVMKCVLLSVYSQCSRQQTKGQEHVSHQDHHWPVSESHPQSCICVCEAEGERLWVMWFVCEVAHKMDIIKKKHQAISNKPCYFLVWNTHSVELGRSRTRYRCLGMVFTVLLCVD